MTHNSEFNPRLASQSTGYQTFTGENVKESRSWTDTAGLVMKAIGWSILAISKLFCIEYPWNRAAELWSEVLDGGKSVESGKTGVAAVAVAELPNPLALDDGPSVDDLFEEFGRNATLREEYDALPDAQDTYRECAIRNLQDKGGILDNGALIESGTVKTYVEFLQSEFGNEVAFITRLVHKECYEGDFVNEIVIPEVVKAIEEEKPFVFIPMVQQSRRDHIVLMAINLKEGTIEYYDPKGSRGQSVRDARLRSLENTTIGAFQSQLMSALASTLGNEIGRKQSPQLQAALERLEDLSTPGMMKQLESFEKSFTESMHQPYRSLFHGSDLQSLVKLQNVLAEDSLDAFIKGMEKVSYDSGIKLAQRKPVASLFYKGLSLVDSIQAIRKQLADVTKEPAVFDHLSLINKRLEEVEHQLGERGFSMPKMAVEDKRPPRVFSLDAEPTPTLSQESANKLREELVPALRELEKRTKYFLENFDEVKQANEAMVRQQNSYRQQLIRAIESEIFSRGKELSPFGGLITNHRFVTVKQEPKQEHQRKGDHSNCGIFVSKFMKERILAARELGSSAEAINEAVRRVGPSDTIRQEMIREIQTL